MGKDERSCLEGTRSRFGQRAASPGGGEAGGLHGSTKSPKKGRGEVLKKASHLRKLRAKASRKKSDGQEI